MTSRDNYPPNFYLRLADDGEHIRKWDRKQFDGSMSYTRSDLPTAPVMTSTTEAEAREMDEAIGEFIARWDDAVDGVCMDADDAQALAREFKRMRSLIYCPGVLRCAKCDFRLIKTVLTPAGAFANEEPDRCPNCDVPLWRVTWKDEAHDAYKTAECQMDRALEAEAALSTRTGPGRDVPPGWRLVPEVATEEMLVAAGCTPNGVTPRGGTDRMRKMLPRRWSAMLSAVPAPPAPTSGPTPTDGGSDA